jgi:hypothetical protein
MIFYSPDKNMEGFHVKTQKQKKAKTRRGPKVKIL